MDVLPPELVNAILDQCVALGPRNCVLELRLVCRLFDKYLKPKACQTITLEFSRLSAASGRRRPRPDALQTIGYHSKAMYIDLTLLRDECRTRSKLYYTATLCRLRFPMAWLISNSPT